MNITPKLTLVLTGNSARRKSNGVPSTGSVFSERILPMMTNARLLVLAMLLCAMSQVDADEKAVNRVWTSVDGRKVRAAFLSVKDGKATVRRESDGRTFSVPLDRLSDEDRQWIDDVSSGVLHHGHPEQRAKEETPNYSIQEQRTYAMAGADGTPAQLGNYFAEGTVSAGGIEMKVVGGILSEGKPVMWVHGKDLHRERLFVNLVDSAFPPLTSENESVGVVTGFSRTGVRFSEALFMHAVPTNQNDRPQVVPPFHFYLSLLSGATYHRAPNDAAPGEDPLPLMEMGQVNQMLPDIYGYLRLGQAGQIAWTRRPYFVGTDRNTLAKHNLVRIEEVELARRTQVEGGVMLRKVVIALKGLEGASQFPDKLGKPLAIQYGQRLGQTGEWYVEDEIGTKCRLLRQDVHASGDAVAVYENGIVLPVSHLLEILQDAVAVPAPAIE